MRSDDHTRIRAMSHLGIGSAPIRSESLLLHPGIPRGLSHGHGQRWWFETQALENLHGSACPIVMCPVESGHRRKGTNMEGVALMFAGAWCRQLSLIHI